MEQPKGFKVPGSSNKVYRLLRALYGLKQAALAWNKELHKLLLKLNFKRSKSDPGVYIFQDKSGIMLFIVYVDNGLLMLNSAKLLKKENCIPKRMGSSRHGTSKRISWFPSYSQLR